MVRRVSVAQCSSCSSIHRTHTVPSSLRYCSKDLPCWETLQPAFLYNRCYSDYGYSARPLLFHRCHCGCHSVCPSTRRRAPRHSSAVGLRSQRHRPRQHIDPPPLLMAQRGERTLSGVYFDPTRVGSYGGVAGLRRVTRLPEKTVKAWLSAQDTYTLHKPARRHFKRRQVIVGGMHQQWQADLVDMSKVKRVNDGMAFLLTMIDVFSKVAWCVPMKNKPAASLVAALQSTFVDVRPQTLQTDKGTEFRNKSVQALLKRYDIHYFYTHNAETKAAVVERFNGTLKRRMWRYFTKHQTWRYIDILPDLMRSYNNARHRMIGMAPSQVNAQNQEQVWQRLYGHDGKGVPKLHVSDRVRVSKYKRTFEKGYEANWSEEVFTIHEVHPSDPPVYRLRDDLGEVLEGTFYELELQKVTVPFDKVYRVEAVLKRRTVGRRKEALVKWFGYSSHFNSWIDAKGLVNYKD